MRNEFDLGRFVPSRDDAAVIGLVLLLYIEHLIYGANRADLSLFFALVHLILLLAVVASRTGRRALENAPLAWVAAPFAVVMLVAAATLVPIAGKLGHPHGQLVPGTRV